MQVNEVLMREQARRRCEEWNWNANVAEIAKQLIEEEVEADSEQFRVLGEEFVKFFGAHDPKAKTFWEIVGQIIETFG